MFTNLSALDRPALEGALRLFEKRALSAEDVAQDALVKVQILTEDGKKFAEDLLSAQARDHAKDARIVDLQVQIADLQKMVFGRKSERQRHEDPNQLSFLGADVVQVADEVAAVAAETVTVVSQRKKHRAKPTPKPIREIVTIIEGKPEDRVGAHGETLVHMGYEESRRLEYVPEDVYILVTRRAKYGTPDTREYQRTAQHLPCLVEGAKVTDTFMLHVALKKYGLGLPLYRQLQSLRGLGVDLADNYLGECVRHIASAFEPIATAIRDNVLSQPFVFVDETPIKQMKSSEKTPSGKDIRTSQLWAWATKHQVYFHYGATRGSQEIRTCLGIPIKPNDTSYADDEPQLWERGSLIGFIICDGYASYNILEKNPHIQRVGCWVHARRKFITYAEHDKNAQDIVTHINHIFSENKKILKNAETNTTLTPHQRHTLIAEQRQHHLQPLIHNLDTLCQRLTPLYPPDSGIGPALTYLRNQWKSLQTFLHHGYLPMDNNTAERAIRPIAVGRKNWLFVGSEDGGKWAATMFSIIESCRLQNINPTDYCTHILTTIVNTPPENRPTLPYHQLTPQALRETIKNLPA